jgi:hypothetical protein
MEGNLWLYVTAKHQHTSWARVLKPFVRQYNSRYSFAISPGGRGCEVAPMAQSAPVKFHHFPA